MNIFYLDPKPETCAQMHCDKHVVKMILEYAQLMSTAHRVLDGYLEEDIQNNRKIKRWHLTDEKEHILYKASHINHPSAIWVRESESNYLWLYTMWCELLKEYTERYGKHHASEALKMYLSVLPRHMPKGQYTEPPPAMPDKYKVAHNSVQSYKNYYLHEKNHFATWKHGKIPSWWIVNV